MTTSEISNLPSGETAAFSSLDRREFLKLFGSGIFVFFSIEEWELFGQEPRAGRSYPEDFNAYLRIGEDGRVSCYTGKIEMGQGINAALAQILAEELEVPFESVAVVLGDTKLCPWDGGTNGSRSVKYFGPALRTAAAEAREVLILLASEQLQVPQDRLVPRSGEIIDRADSGKKIAYGALAKGRTIERRLGKKPGLKPVSNYTVCGKSLPRPDAHHKVTGKAQFAGDIRLPGMLYGKVLRPPIHGARLKGVDVSAAKQVKRRASFRKGTLWPWSTRFPIRRKKRWLSSRLNSIFRRRTSTRKQFTSV